MSLVPLSAALPPRGPRRVRTPLRRCCVLALLWTLLAGLAWSPAQAQTRSRLQPGDFTDAPVRQPASVKAGLEDPSYGFQFGAGHPAHSVEIDGVSGTLEPEGGLFDEGAMVTASFLLGPVRLGYALQVYRHSLPAGQVVEGQSVTFAAFESHQVWAFHGIRPVRSLYLGYGLGLQSRYTRLRSGDSTRVERRDASPMAGLLLDYRFNAPYSLQLRWVEDLAQGEVASGGPILQLAYYVPF